MPELKTTISQICLGYFFVLNNRYKYHTHTEVSVLKHRDRILIMSLIDTLLQILKWPIMTTSKYRLTEMVSHFEMVGLGL